MYTCCRWYLYKFPNSFDQETELEDPYRVADAEWLSSASTGNRIDNMAIDSGLFLNFPKDGFFYRFTVFAQRRGSSDGNRGQWFSYNHS